MSHDKFQSCIDACMECSIECIHCANACLDEKDVQNLRRCIRLNLECADMCILASKMMAAGSEFANEICNMCAKVCQACGEECGSHSHMDHCRKCSEVCMRCAEECRAMVRETVH